MENERFELQNGANNKENGQNWTGNPKRIFKMEQIIPETIPDPNANNGDINGDNISQYDLLR
jgi:hypothetical protein